MRRDVKIKLLFFIFLLSILSACGFHLRGQDYCLVLMKSIYIQTSEPYGHLTKTLAAALKSAGVRVVEISNQASYTLDIKKVEKTTESIGFGFSNQVSVNTLTYALTYRLLNHQGRELISPRTIRCVRDFTINTNQALAGNVIPESLLIEMRRDLASQLIGELNAWETNENKSRSAL
ncbi:MAG: hypothetical protein ACD_44C00109G0007 [uncultured bacterium]|nr:MAG: hypothetical protein ACD_44C00109G0007 [uncultured bacterium]OGT15092.1 MAG: hypothetical protein A3B69_03265 [Gammaproteobacteria bacterium RIFCSPHIGHO2_02_FULL_38_33]OGT24901.1 MAG: hypothetical protein A2W47_00165 [Gammaproteobacteria bacterium RIFCSPHIGHO2_12_38_15]OGT69492.1 MAG: hypothetical protein A3I12_02640 [Gammaproteobacteria bacterium RIFCSPLOWO2_02_FULL_38_11]OGT76924.1 MAG: hypothetical protein A3G71_05865 [Gammaproteobacteria bacterium RIFCSPLOWO2_12_FULL_38_14]